MPQVKESTAYLLDTVKMATGKFIPGAIVYSGRKRVETMQWKEQAFDTQQEADDFVRTQFAEKNLIEAGNEGELKSL